jgi:predicted permease
MRPEHWLFTIPLRLRSLFRWAQADQEVDDELRDHLERKTEEYVAQGMTREEAHHRAHLDLDGIEQTKEKCRDARRVNWIQDLIQDVRFGLRMLRKNPGFAAVAVLTLALGIGANTAIFSVIEAVILRPLPYKDSVHLALLADSQDPANGAFTFEDIEAFKSQSRIFQDVAVYYRDSGFSRVTLTARGEPVSVQGAFVSANFFSLMGVRPEMGRVFTLREEVQRERVVVVSYSLWIRRFGGASDLLGQIVQIDGLNWEIIGVMPPTFQFPGRDQEFWAPLTTNRYWDDPALHGNIDSRHTRAFYERWQAIGRLSSGATIAEAQTEIDAVFLRSDVHPERNSRRGVTVTPLRVTLSGNTRLALIVLSCAVSFVLLIACSNVANLMLARGVAREREMAVRTVLGAGRGRLSQQLLVESAVLTGLASGVGLAFASMSVRALVAFAPSDIPRLEQAGVDRGALVFALMISVLAAGIFGLVPAWKASRSDPGESLRARTRSGGRSLTRTRSVLVSMEFALAVLLLAGAGLLIRSFLAVEGVDLGFNPEHVLTMKIELPSATVQSRNALYDAVLERVRTYSGIQAAGEVDALFELGGVGNLGLRMIDGQAPERKDQWTPLNWASIRGDYFQAMGTTLLRGRYFTPQDGPQSPLVAIIDESMARRYWPGQDPIGKRFKGQDPRGFQDDWLTVVGVVHGMRRSGVEKNPVPHVFEPWGQAIDGDRTAYLVVRTTRDSRAAVAALRNIVRGLTSTAILSSVSTMEEQLASQISPRRFQTWLLSLFSVIAMVLAAIGIFGVMHYSVADRTHEFGIRAALGAHPHAVMRLVLGQATTVAFCGVAMGTGAALALTRFMSSLLFDVSPRDPLTFVGTLLLLALITLLASYLPARRAMRVDPMVALRYE